MRIGFKDTLEIIRGTLRELAELITFGVTPFSRRAGLTVARRGVGIGLLLLLFVFK